MYEYGIGVGPFTKGISKGHVGAKQARNDDNKYMLLSFGSLLVYKAVTNW